MEIANFIQKFLNWEKTRTKIILMLMYIAILGINYQTILSFEFYRIFFSMTCVQFFLLIIIHIWIYKVPNIINESKLPNAFSNESYQKEYDSHRSLLYQFNFKNAKCEKIGFLLIAITVVCAVILSLRKIFETLKLDAEWLTFILLLVSFVLNFYGYWANIQHKKFFKEITNTQLSDLPYNRYIPSATLGLKRLIQETNLHAVMFFLISLLYTLAFAIVFRMAQNEKSIRFYIFIIMIIVIVCGLGTFGSLFLKPRIYLKKLWQKWQEDEIAKFEKELFEAEKTGDMQAIDRFVEIIDRLNKDQLNFKFDIFWGTLVTILTTAINIASLVYK